MDEVVMNMACGEEFRVLYEMLQKFNLHSTQIPQLDTYLDTLRSMTTKKNITFGVSDWEMVLIMYSMCLANMPG